MARIQTGTLIEDRSIPQAKAAKGYLGRAVLISNIWESTYMSFVTKVGYFVDDDVNEHIKRNLEPSSYVFTPVVRLCTSPTGDVVSPQCKVEFLRLSPNKYNQLCDAIRRNPKFTHVELMVDSSGQYETTVPVPVATPIPFVPEIQAFINTLDVETLLQTIKMEMGSPLSVLDARIAAQGHFAQPDAGLAAAPAPPAGQFAPPSGFPAFQSPQGGTTTPPAFNGQPANSGAPTFNGQPATPPAFNGQPANSGAPAFQQATQFAPPAASPAASPAAPPAASPAAPPAAPPAASPAAPPAASPAAPPAASPAAPPQGSFQFPQFGGFQDSQQ